MIKERFIYIKVLKVRKRSYICNVMTGVYQDHSTKVVQPAFIRVILETDKKLTYILNVNISLILMHKSNTYADTKQIDIGIFFYISRVDCQIFFINA